MNLQQQRIHQDKVYRFLTCTGIMLNPHSRERTSAEARTNCSYGMFTNKIASSKTLVKGFLLNVLWQYASGIM